MGTNIFDDGKIQVRRFGRGSSRGTAIQITPYGEYAIYSEEEFAELVKKLQEAAKE